jgi:hypothetical protein
MMKKISWCLLIVCLVLMDYYPTLAAPDNFRTSNSSEVKNTVWISWGNVATLAFHGIPNESQTGEITFVVKSTSRCKRYSIKMTGVAFNDGNCFLDTEYQSGNDQIWHKAEDTFVVSGILGEVNKIRFQAKTGPKVSSQHAGAYSAKIAIIAVSIQ